MDNSEQFHLEPKWLSNRKFEKVIPPKFPHSDYKVFRMSVARVVYIKWMYLRRLLSVEETPDIVRYGVHPLLLALMLIFADEIRF
jgi:hypothetical protein